MNIEEGTQLGQRLFVCFLCSVFFFTIFEPIVSYGLQLLGLAVSPLLLIFVITILVTVFYVFGYTVTFSTNGQSQRKTHKFES